MKDVIKNAESLSLRPYFRPDILWRFFFNFQGETQSLRLRLSRN